MVEGSGERDNLVVTRMACVKNYGIDTFIHDDLYFFKYQTSFVYFMTYIINLPIVVIALDLSFPLYTFMNVRSTL